MRELLAIKNGKFKFVFGDFKIYRDLPRFFIDPVFGSTLWALFSHNSFDAHKIPLEQWPPSHRLLDAWFLGDLKQLQNRDFSTSNRSKPIRVLTRTKCSCSDDRLPISFLLSDFQPNRRNFLYLLPLFHNQVERGSTRREKNHTHTTFDSTYRSIDQYKPLLTKPPFPGFPWFYSLVIPISRISRNSRIDFRNFWEI